MELAESRGETVTIGGALAQTEFAVGEALIRPVEGESAERGDDWLMWTSASRAWPREWSALELDSVDEGIRLTAALPAGRYLVRLGPTFPQGDALYGLILDVR